jgi:hypothetical protein
MTPRTLETALARFTLGVLVIYIPVETWASIPYGMLNPNYLIDAIAMVLLLIGSLHSLRARPHPAPALLCAAFAWTAANGWRATSWRYAELAQGRTLDYGSGEFLTVAIATAIGLVCFALSIFLVAKAGHKQA